MMNASVYYNIRGVNKNVEQWTTSQAVNQLFLSQMISKIYNNMLSKGSHGLWMLWMKEFNLAEVSGSTESIL